MKAEGTGPGTELICPSWDQKPVWLQPQPQGHSEPQVELTSNPTPQLPGLHPFAMTGTLSLSKL